MIKNQQQSGFVLLVFVIIIAFAVSAYYFSSVSVVEIQQNSQQKTNAALKQAKLALIAYAKTNWRIKGDFSRLGKLPCPDFKSPLAEDSDCGLMYANAIGFFPWRTLSLATPKDNSGSCLLYAVSPAYKDRPPITLNPDSFGQLLTVDKAGLNLQTNQPEDRIIAMIIAPNVALQGQVRAVNNDSICHQDYNNISAYLDNNGITDNSKIKENKNNRLNQLVSKYPDSEKNSNSLNDQIEIIRYKDIWGDDVEAYLTAVNFNQKLKETTQAIANCFAKYGSKNGKHLPMPAPLNLNLNDYRNDKKYKDSSNFNTAFAGRLPYNVKNANNVLSSADKKKIVKNNYCTSLSNFKEYSSILKSWQDHFFYAVSKAHKPDNTVNACNNDCVKVNGVEYAAIIFFSGIKRNDTAIPQQRYSKPFDTALSLDGDDDKDDVANYLENNNATKFPDNNGNAHFNKVNLSHSNDIMYCIKSNMDVVECG